MEDIIPWFENMEIQLARANLMQTKNNLVTLQKVLDLNLHSTLNEELTEMN